MILLIKHLLITSYQGVSRLLDYNLIISYINQIQLWIENNLLVTANLIELAVILVLYILSYIFARKLKDSTKIMLDKIPALKQNARMILSNKILRLFIFTITLWIYVLILKIIGHQPFYSNIIGSLFTAWIIIQIISIFLPGNFSVKIISSLVWTVTALKILNIYEKTITILGNLSFQSGNLNISLLLVIKGILILSILFWASGKLNEVLQKRIKKTENLTPSIKVLFTKLTKFILYTIAFLLTLSSIGVDLSTFAFLGGAIGVGLGFGLQKIVSNFISGIIILLDKSIKPGDIVEINDVYGRIKSLDTRFVSIVTLAGKEYLVPNENFITKEVINWSYSDELVRIDIPVGVSYDSDMNLVKELMLKALEGKERIVSTPPPACLMEEFGDNTVNFSLRFWIKDPNNGIANIKSDVLYTVWDLFVENDINIAFPQLDLHLQSMSGEIENKLEKIFKQKTNNNQDTIGEVAVSEEETEN